MFDRITRLGDVLRYFSRNFVRSRHQLSRTLAPVCQTTGFLPVALHGGLSLHEQDQAAEKIIQQNYFCHEYR